MSRISRTKYIAAWRASFTSFERAVDSISFFATLKYSAHLSIIISGVIFLAFSPIPKISFAASAVSSIPFIEA